MIFSNGETAAPLACCDRRPKWRYGLAARMKFRPGIAASILSRFRGLRAMRAQLPVIRLVLPLKTISRIE
jgi:hypothetical protein